MTKSLEEKKKEILKEVDVVDVLFAASSLVAKDRELQKLWVEKHLNDNLVGIEGVREKGGKVKYIVAVCYASVFCHEKNGVSYLTVMGKEDHIKILFPCSSKKVAIEVLCHKLSTFPFFHCVLLKKTLDGKWVKVPYESGEVVKDELKASVQNNTFFPFKGDGMVYVKYEGIEVIEQLSKECKALDKHLKSKVK